MGGVANRALATLHPEFTIAVLRKWGHLRDDGVGRTLDETQPAKLTAVLGHGPALAYARFVAPITAVVWVAVVSGFLYRRRPATASTPDLAAVPAT
jgi:hypothetical protein